MGLLEKNTRSKCKRRQKLTAYHCVGLLEKGDPYQTQDHLNHGIRGMLDPNPKCRKHLKIVVNQTRLQHMETFNRRYKFYMDQNMFTERARNVFN